MASHLGVDILLKIIKVLQPLVTTLAIHTLLFQLQITLCLMNFVVKIKCRKKYKFRIENTATSQRHYDYLLIQSSEIFNN